MTTDYESPVQQGKNIVIGQAAILWGDGFMHPDRGHVDGGWILPGCIRTTNADHATRVCRDLNESIKAAFKPKIIAKPDFEAESIGQVIAQQLKEIR